MFRVQLKTNMFLQIVMVFLLTHVLVGTFALAEDDNACTGQYESESWKKEMNRREVKVEKYPDKRKITPETVRIAINEYYIPQISELIGKGVDYYEWLNQLDDPYLNRYKVDIKVDPADERLNLFWKRDF